MADSQTFTYQSSDKLADEIDLMPLVNIHLSFSEHRISAVALVDTGASVNVLPYHLGKALGLDWQQQNVMVDLTGNLAHFEARGVVVNAQIGDLEQVRLAFAWTQADEVPLILGQVNFLAEFDVCVYQSQRKLHISRKQT